MSDQPVFKHETAQTRLEESIQLKEFIAVAEFVKAIYARKGFDRDELGCSCCKQWVEIIDSQLRASEVNASILRGES